MGGSRREGPVSLAARALRLPLRLIPSAARVPILSGPLRGKWWVVGSSLHSCWLGTFEVEKQALFAAALGRGDIVYDVGAHVGMYSLLAAAHVGSGGHVYSFEPLPRNLDYLEQHLALNRVDNCTVLDVAVSSRAGTAAFDESSHPAMGHLGAAGGRVITVRTVTLDDLVANGVTRPPSVIKIDIEGAEYDCLRGAASVLASSRPIIFVATHGPDVHERCCRLLDGWGFDLFSLDGLPLHATTEVLALPRS
jgi:FkbM family methyltransferase